MPVFAVTTARHTGWDQARDIRGQPFWDQHAAFADELAERGVIILGGPIGGGDGEDLALLAVEAADEDAVRTVFDADPWTVHRVCRIKQIRPWTLWLDGRSRKTLPTGTHTVPDMAQSLAADIRRADPPIWRRFEPLPGCGLTGAADPLFGSGLEHRRLFPGRPASGHPAARAQAFLRARISAALFSRAIYGMSSA